MTKSGAGVSAGDRAGATVAERLRLGLDRLTRAERQLAMALLSDYPIAGLTSVAELARRAEVSAPTVIRMVQKLGFAGYPEFQETLRGELAAQLSTPLAKFERWSGRAPESHMLNRFAGAVIENLEHSLKLTDHRAFDAVVGCLSDCERAVHTVGGRLSRVLADYLFTQLHGLRPGVSALPATTTLWPQHLANMQPGDILVIFDVRRYERDLIELAEIAARRRAVIVLFTDQWMSPISAVAAHILPLRIEAPSSWDSLAVPMIMVEALLAATAERIWPQAAERLRLMEQLFDEMRRFRK
ncbi:MurR/RpiR family transcriptional regulator [Rhodoligotrophos defluvii]|uniref:MurR/RpiR family transcriptional regulator n=1 Tax=Rhodoligotrophos defluvii TaxID=2561934 RepID=UPI0010C975D4|nr:MurR/RpiR family transcriptional regulator [Rhodoligotrophos defluvii]